MTPLWRLLRYAAPYRLRLAGAMAAMLLYAGSEAGLAYLIKPIIDEVLRNRQRLGFVAGAIIAFYVLKGIGSYAGSYLMTDVGQRVVQDIRNALFGHILGQSAGFFARRTSGQLMSRITNDVGQVQQAVSETIADLLRESLALIGYAALLVYYDVRLALVCLTGAPIVLYPLVRLGQRLRRTTRRSQEELENLSHLTAEAFTGHRIVKAFGTERYEAEKFAQASRRLYRTNMKVTSTLAALPPLMELLGGVGIIAALWYGSREIAAKQLTQGEFVAFTVAAFMMYGPIKKLSRVNASLQQAMGASERIFEMLDMDTEVRDRPGARALAPLGDAIEFRHVGFRYDEGGARRVLRDVSFSVRAGQLVAIVGLSGAGSD